MRGEIMSRFLKMLSKSKCLSFKKADGFTLLEVLVVMAIAGTMIAIAIPALISSSKNADLKSAAQEMYGQFQRAKIEAIKRNQPVAIVFDTSGPVHQYQVFVDSVTDNKTLDAGETLLAEIKMKHGIELTGMEFSDDDTGFTPRGRPSGGSGSVIIKHTLTDKGIKLTTSISGYVHLEEGH